MFKLKKIRSGVFLLEFKYNRDLCITFLRYQEFYEGLNNKIREKKFTLVQQMGHYVRDIHNDPGHLWTYTNDWEGFNIPAEIIQQVWSLGIDDLNCYDYLMKGIHDLIMMDTKAEKAYLIGTTKAQSKKYSDKRIAELTLDHELTHAMFYLEKKYRNRVLTILEKTNKELIKELSNILKNVGYPDKVIKDEINAYITTGEGGKFDIVSKSLEADMDKLRNKLRKLHKNVFDLWKREKKIKWKKK